MITQLAFERILSQLNSVRSTIAKNFNEDKLENMVIREVDHTFTNIEFIYPTYFQVIVSTLIDAIKNNNGISLDILINELQKLN